MVHYWCSCLLTWLLQLVYRAHMIGHHHHHQNKLCVVAWCRGYANPPRYRSILVCPQSSLFYSQQIKIFESSAFSFSQAHLLNTLKAFTFDTKIISQLMVAGCTNISKKNTLILIRTSIGTQRHISCVCSNSWRSCSVNTYWDIVATDWPVPMYHAYLSYNFHYRYTYRER